MVIKLRVRVIQVNESFNNWIIVEKAKLHGQSFYQTELEQFYPIQRVQNAYNSEHVSI
jgi:hypothetical protein